MSSWHSGPYNFDAVRDVVDDLERRAPTASRLLQFSAKEISRRYGLESRHKYWREINRLMTERGFVRRISQGRIGWLVALPVRNAAIDDGTWLLRTPPSLLYG